MAVERSHWGLFTDRGPDQPVIPLQPPHHLQVVGEPTRVRPVVRHPGQSEHRVRELEAQRVPSGSAPPFGHPVPLENDVIDTALGQGVAGDQASLATPDDDGFVNLGHQLHRPLGGRQCRSQSI
jgi:hypothetical protein